MEDTFEIFHKPVRYRLQDQTGLAQLGVPGDHYLVLRVRPEGGHEPALQAGPDLVGQVEDGSLDSEDKRDPLVILADDHLVLGLVRLCVDGTSHVVLNVNIIQLFTRL